MPEAGGREEWEATVNRPRVSFGGDEMLWDRVEVMLVQHCHVLRAAAYSLLNGSFYVSVTSVLQNKTNK